MATQTDIQKSVDDTSLTDYGYGGEKLYDFGTPDSGLVNGFDPVAYTHQGLAGLSSASKQYLLKKSGWKTLNDKFDLDHVNTIIKAKGGAPISDWGQANQALAPLIAKRNAGKGVLGSVLGIAAPIALSLLVPGLGTAIGAGLGLGGTAAAVGGNALLGAGLGGLTSAVTGGKPLKSALMGGITGGIGGYLTAPQAGAVKAISGASKGSMVIPGTLNAAPGYSWGTAIPAAQGSASAGFMSKLDKLGNLGKAFQASGLGDQLMGGGQQTQQQGQQSQITPQQLQTLMAQLQQQRGVSGNSPLGMVGRNALAKGGLISGPGDGMSDGVPATVGGTTPAALSDSEHVTPALQVSLLGRGSPKAGSQRIQKLIDEEIADMYGKNLNPRALQRKAMKETK